MIMDLHFWNQFILPAISFLVLLTATIHGQQPTDPSSSLPVKYEELTSPDFIKAVEQAQSTCLIPFGVLEKHGAHLPLGTDLLAVREVALRAARQEYSIVFPEYYFGQIFEAKHQPGTMAYSHQTIWKLLQETCDELSRNGIKKIIIVNGHGGNNNFLRYFGQVQLEKRRDYAVYLFVPEDDPKILEQVGKLKKSEFDYHGGELETSTMIAYRPDLVHLERAKQESGQDQQRLNNLPKSYTGIWWYARFPNHYAGDGSQANPEIGELLINSKVDQLLQMIRAVKKDTTTIQLQNRFYDESEQPVPKK